MGLNQTPNEVFRHFDEFGSWVFLEIACDDSLQQGEVNLTEKKLGAQIWAKRTKTRSEIRFFAILSSLVH